MVQRGRRDELNERKKKEERREEKGVRGHKHIVRKKNI
jgi:hypothetical protein